MDRRVRQKRASRKPVDIDFEIHGPTRVKGMIFERIYDEKLAQAAYLIGCAATGEALVVDPNRDVEQVLAAAAAEGLTVTHVAETHIHADFVSGSRELARRSGAALFLSGEGGEAWKYRFADEAGATLLADGDRFMVGSIRIDVLHTPGHTPEHLVFVVTDTAGADRPMGICTGDFVFVGDVGRPDLLERAVGMEGTMTEAARTLFRSLQKIKTYPDYLQLWPGHGAGSACGKSLGAMPQTTLGYERRFNPGLVAEDEDAFVQAVLEGQPEPPRYFAEMKRINRDGPPLLAELERGGRIPDEDLADAVERGMLVVDTRPAGTFAEAHLRGTLNIPFNRSFTTWAGWLVPYDRDFFLVIDDSEGGRVEEVLRDLAMIGLDRVAGYFGASAIPASDAAGSMSARIPPIGATEVALRMKNSEIFTVDVRGPAEWEAGHLPGVPNIPLGQLVDRLGEIPKDRPVALHCASGGRSSIAASLLRMHGFDEVLNMTGGFNRWKAEGHPVERGHGARPAAPR